MLPVLKIPIKSQVPISNIFPLLLTQNIRDTSFLVCQNHIELKVEDFMGINPNPSIMPEEDSSTITHKKRKIRREALPPFTNTTPQTTPMSPPTNFSYPFTLPIFSGYNPSAKDE